MKQFFLILIFVFIFIFNVQSQHSSFNPQLNLLGYNSWAVTPKEDTVFNNQYFNMIDVGVGISNSFSTEKFIYLELGIYYKSYGERCCQKSRNSNVGIWKYNMVSTLVEPKYYFNNNYFCGVLLFVNWLTESKSYVSSNQFTISGNKRNMSIQERKDMPQDVILKTFASVGFIIGREVKIKDKQYLTLSTYFESPFRSINRFTAEKAKGYYIYGNFGISIGYGLRSKNYQKNNLIRT